MVLDPESAMGSATREAAAGESRNAFPEKAAPTRRKLPDDRVRQGISCQNSGSCSGVGSVTDLGDLQRSGHAVPQDRAAWSCPPPRLLEQPSLAGEAPERRVCRR